MNECPPSIAPNACADICAASLSIEAFNRDCFCVGVDQAVLSAKIDAALGAHGCYRPWPTRYVTVVDNSVAVGAILALVRGISLDIAQMALPLFHHRQQTIHPFGCRQHDCQETKIDPKCPVSG